MFKKKDSNVDKGIEALNNLTAVLMQINETLKRVEGKIDVIYAAYESLNQTK